MDNKAIKTLIAIFLVLIIGLFLGMEIQKEVDNNKVTRSLERIDCSPLGFCPGNEVMSTNISIANGINVTGIVVLVDDDVLTLDTGDEEWYQVNEYWVKHKL